MIEVFSFLVPSKLPPKVMLYVRLLGGQAAYLNQVKLQSQIYNFHTFSFFFQKGKEIPPIKPKGVVKVNDLDNPVKLNLLTSSTYQQHVKENEDKGDITMQIKRNISVISVVVDIFENI